jgi:hypothetical protein
VCAFSRDFLCVFLDLGFQQKFSCCRVSGFPRFSQGSSCFGISFCEDEAFSFFSHVPGMGFALGCRVRRSRLRRKRLPPR